MKVLWIVNAILPYPSKMLGIEKTVFGGWLLGLLDSLNKKKDVEIAVATTYDGKDFKRFYDGKNIYYLLPCENNIKYDSNLEQYWKQVNEDFKPDLVHLNGSEFAHGLSFLNACPNVKSVLSIQGLLDPISKVYLLGISNKDIYSNLTFRDIVRLDNLKNQQRRVQKRTLNEREVLKKVDALIGRTQWDYEETLKIVGKDKYYKCNENLRDSFYHNDWDIKNIERNTIFVSQASYPIKGFHELIKALALVKEKIPNIKVYVAGCNILQQDTLMKKIKEQGYTRFLKRLIKKYNVSSNIEFTGLLSEEDMIKMMLKCNLYVQASALENSPNSLGEAMIMGMPIVASNVGGTPTMIVNKKEGLLYKYLDTKTFAKNIIELLSNDKRAIELGKNAKKHALITHDRDVNSNTMYKIYEKVLNIN